MLNEAEVGSPEYWAEKTPDAVAVVFGAETLTYQQWNDKANRLADSLSKQGLGEGDRIGMRFRLGICWFVVQRALQKLGVVQVTVNYRFTADEALYILQDSNAKGLICDDDDPLPWTNYDIGFLLTVNQPVSMELLRMEDLLEQGEAVPRFGPTRPRMITYTSGTTGYPKGVPPVNPPKTPAEKERLERYYASFANRPYRPEGRRVVMLALPVHHGAGPMIATVATAVGGTTVLLNPFEPEEALRHIQEHGVNMWTSVPTMMQRIRSLPKEVLDKYDVSSMQTVICGAAPVGSDLANWIRSYFGDHVLWETYGLTEAGIVGAVGPEDKKSKPGSSALPFDGAEVAIVDEDWNHLPQGEIGEIAVNTPITLRGYIGKKPLSDDSWRDGFFRTGDVGYLDEDGYLFITDRIKDMIVAGGVNIYPAEIEKVLTSHPDVLSCAVIGIPHEEFGEQPMAFIIRRDYATVSEDELREYLTDKLARYKHPRVYEFVGALPLNTTGKILKNELRDKFWQDKERKI